MVAAAILVVGDTRLLHAEHLADQRPEHRRRPAELPGQDRSELLSLAVRRGVIQVDTDPPVALAHDRRRVQEQGETQAADIRTINLARLHVIGQKRPAPGSSVALAVNADQVHGQTVSHEHDSKYVPSSRQAIVPSLTVQSAPLTRLAQVALTVKMRHDARFIPGTNQRPGWKHRRQCDPDLGRHHTTDRATDPFAAHRAKLVMDRPAHTLDGPALSVRIGGEATGSHAPVQGREDADAPEPPSIWAASSCPNAYDRERAAEGDCSAVTRVIALGPGDSLAIILRTVAHRVGHEQRHEHGRGYRRGIAQEIG